MTPSWFSEIEAFPSAVLAHHWPSVANLGDMTKISRRVLLGEIEVPDVLVGGMPCQAFSVAGMREGMADVRGQLTMKYVELANAIDAVRVRAGNPETVIVWENVPGVLSDKSNAFGCFLGALAGEDRELQPSGKKWTNAGCVYGPQRAIAWRVLDAQYFGVAQRRRRVFVVASARTDIDPAEILFERDSLRRDTPPRREAEKDAAQNVGNRVKRPSHWEGGPHPILNQSHNTGGIGASNQELFSQRGAGIVSQAIAIHPHCIGRAANAGTQGKEYLEDGAAYTCDARGVSQAVAFGQNRQSGPVETSHALSASAGPHGRLDFASETFLVQSVALRGREGGATAELGGPVDTALRASQGGGDKPHVMAVHGTQDPCVSDSTAFALGRNNGGENAVYERLAVRRLTPVECEFLQGFPRDHTHVPYRNKPATDGPRYKAIGNSMAVPCMAWIGSRIIAMAAHV
jgi:DNA (cytosine-5)-methyltransferase 1